MGERGKFIYPFTCPGREIENSGPEGSDSYKDIPRFLGIGRVKVEVTILKNKSTKVVCKHHNEDETCKASGQEFVPCKYLNSEKLFTPYNNQ